MKISKIVLYNFSSYQEEHIFNLHQKTNLIGGLNGAGKSSLQRALIWAFFGYKMFNSNVRTLEYDHFVKSVLNKNSAIPTLKVEISFKHLEDDYKVSRIINFEPEKYDETVSYHKNNLRVNKIDLLEDYSKQMIESFFFDGEDILDYIKNNKIEKYVFDLIKIAFNLDTFVQLKSDLEIVKKNKIKNQKTDLLKKYTLQHSQIVKKLELETKLSKTLQNTISQNALTILAIESSMAKNAVLSNDKLHNLTKENEQNKKQLQISVANIKQFMLTDLNDFLINKMIKVQVKILDLDRKSRSKQLLVAYENLETTNLKTKIDYSLEKKLIDHSLTNINYPEINSILNKYKTQIQNDVKIRALIKASETGSKFIDQLDNYDFLVDENARLFLEMEKTNQKIKKIELNLERVSIELEKQEKIISKNMLENNAVIERDLLEVVIVKYLEQQTVIINDLLCKKFISVYQKIARKSSLIDNITIVDRQLIVSYKGKALNINQISSGEKQILILALLFTIIKEAKIAVPLVLDSFFIRLDSHHTNNILQFIDEELNQQVIFLITDKEISKKEYQFFNSKEHFEYLLINDGASTQIKKGFYKYED